MATTRRTSDWFTFFSPRTSKVSLSYEIPKVDTGTRGILNLLGLLRRIEDDVSAHEGCDLDVTLSFAGCTFLAHHGVAIVGGVIRGLQAQGANVFLDESSITSRVHQNLVKNGFLKEFAKQGGRQSGNTVQYRHHRSSHEEESVIQYLQTDWLGRGFVSLSDKLRDVIVGKVWEIYANAFEHSGSDLGVFSCGQYYPAAHTLHLTVVDFGRGIPENVRAYKRLATVRPEAALKWAMQRGTSTRATPGFAGGLGLTILREFIQLNGGTLEIISNDGRALISNKGDQFESVSVPFRGTIVNIEIVSKDAHYVLVSEDQ